MSCGTIALLLWTDSGVRLRGFRKSHHLIPASPDDQTIGSGIAVGSDASAIARAGPACVSTQVKRQGRDGMSLLEGIIDSRNNPLAVVEDIAADNNWAFERSGEDEVTIVSEGDWTDYQLSFTWMSEIEALHLACAFDMKIPPARRAEVQRLIAADQRAIVDRAFRPLDPHRHDHAPPGAGAAGRAGRLDRAMREHAGRRHPCLRALLSRRSSSWSGPASVRAEAMRRGDVRYRGRGVAPVRPAASASTVSSRANAGPIRRDGGVAANVLVARFCASLEPPVG